MADVMIEARDLTKRYGDFTAVKKVSFEVRKGEVLGFLGPNGAGKTTTMKVLTCFLAPTEGTAKVNGCDVFEDPMGVRRAIGYLPESTPLYPEMMVLEFLEWAGHMRGLKGDDLRKRLKACVEQTALGDVIAKEIRALSKGFRQRVGLAQALIHEPPILILDEPMSGLDPNQAVEIRDVIKEIGRERTVILSTHNLAEVQVTCDRVLIIAKGALVADDTPAGLRDRAGKPRFLATVLVGEGSYKDRANSKAVREAFADIPGIDRVREVSAPQTDETAFELVPKGNEDLRADIFRAAIKGNFVLIGLNREGTNFEKAFRELTLGNDSNDGDDAPKKKPTRKTSAKRDGDAKRDDDAKATGDEEATGDDSADDDSADDGMAASSSAASGSDEDERADADAASTDDDVETDGGGKAASAAATEERA